MEYLWGWFWKLSARRSTGDAIQPIDYTLIKHWSELTETIITPDEIETLTAMDDAYMQSISTERSERYERARNSQGD